MFSAIMNFLANEILTQAAVVMALVGLIGLVLQKKPFERVMSGVIKIYVGMTIFTLGLNAICAQVDIFTKMSLKIVGASDILNGATRVPIIASYDNVMSAAALTLGLAYVVNIIIARFTPMKIIYLTGHWSHWTCICVCAVLMNYLGIASTQAILIGGVVVGIYQVVFPFILQPYTKVLTGGAPIAFGHGVSFCALIGSFIGSKIGDPKDSFEDIELSGRLSFLKEVVITVALTMSIMYVGLALIVGKDFVMTLSGGKNWIMFSIFAGFAFSAGLMALLYGIRMFIAEITPAFQGISTKLVPGAIPAFDCPVFFQYGQNSLLIGFVIAQICSVISMAILMQWNMPVPILMVTYENFFGGGVVALFANKFGGKRAAVISAMFFGFTATLGRALFFPMLGPMVAFAQTTAEWDQMVVCTLVGWVGKLIGLAQYVF